MIRGPQGPRMLCSSQPNRAFARAPTRIFFWRQPLRVGVRADGTDPYGKSEPLQGAHGGLTADEFLLLREAVDERRCREEVGVSTLAEAAAAYRPDPGCSECGARGEWRDGLTPAGVPRWRCRCCGRRFTSLTGTALEHCRKPLATWVSFIRPMRHNVPIECAAELCGVTHKTAFEWRHRVLATISGHRDRIPWRDTVWADETNVNPD